MNFHNRPELIVVAAGALVVSVAAWRVEAACSQKTPTTSACPGDFTECKAQGMNNSKCTALGDDGREVQFGPFSCEDSNAQVQCIDDTVTAHCTKKGMCIFNIMTGCHINESTWVYTTHVRKKEFPCPQG